MTHRSPLLTGPPAQRALAAAVFVLGLCSVAPLLAWVYGLGSFAVWFWALAAPGMLFVFVLAMALNRTDVYPDLRVGIAAGVLGGVVGTIGYDVIRMPFLAAGYRLFAPINSYGILILGTTHSSPLTDFVGWLYNFANGLMFGVAYGMIAIGRRWWWGIPWAFFLETMTIVTPYAAAYGIAGHPDIIAIAYLAHVAYGTPLGLICMQAARWTDADGPPIPNWWALGGVLIALVAFNRPWGGQAGLARAEAMRPGPASVVVSGRFQPEWVRVAQDGCVQVKNDDRRAYDLTVPAKTHLAASGSGSLCFPSPGVKRVQLNGVAYSGGFVIVDPSLKP